MNRLLRAPLRTAWCCGLALLLIAAIAAGLEWWAAARDHQAADRAQADVVAASAYRRTLHAVTMLSPAQYVVWATTHGSPAGALHLADGTMHQLRGAVSPAERRHDVQPLAADLTRYTAAGAHLLAGPSSPPDSAAAALNPRYLALTSRLDTLAGNHEADARRLSDDHLSVALLRLDALVSIPLAILLLALLVIAVRAARREALTRLAHLERLTEEALTDPVSGAGSLRAFRPELTREVGRAQRNATALTLALLEIDVWPQIEVARGQARAGELLAAVAGLLAGRRVEDRTFRLDGGRFALLLPGATAREVYPLLERLRARATEEVGSTVTAGAADLLGRRDTVEGMLRRAEQALAEARLAGGNAVMVYAARLHDSAAGYT